MTDFMLYCNLWLNKEPETCTQSLEQVIRVLVGDIWGEKAESSDGLTNESDKSAASKWVCEPPPVSWSLKCSVTIQVDDFNTFFFEFNEMSVEIE